MHNSSNQLYVEQLEVPGKLYQAHFMPDLHQVVLSLSLQTEFAHLNIFLV